jgi:hypothetical protein
LLLILEDQLPILMDIFMNDIIVRSSVGQISQEVT